MEHYDILIVGGGAAGIAAAKECRGCSVLLVDGAEGLGGVLLQCAHRGFGREQTGMEYAAQLIEDFPREVTLALNTTVLSLSPHKTALLSGRDLGRREISFSQLILASGCREIPIGALPIGGTRPAGIFTAGQMQKRINLQGYVPEGPAVILGSGDLGLILAGHLAKLGVAVTLVEQRDSCGGMARNRHCLQDPAVTLICGDTVARVEGYPHITGCVTGKGRFLPCRTLLIAAGLQPERELVRGLEGEGWIQLCGNCRTVHPMVEAVVKEGKNAGLRACRNIRGSI